MDTKRFLIVAALAMALTLTGCSRGDIGYSSGQHITFDGNDIVVGAPWKPDARIDPQGDLRIGASAVAVTPAQRQLLQRYYSQAMTVKQDGIATGKAGAALGAHAVGSVFDNLLAGTPDKIDKDMDTRGKAIEAAAEHLCSNLLQLQDTQRELAAQLPAFQPYAPGRGDRDCDRHAVNRADH